MHPNADKTRQAISLIRSTGEEVAELLSDTPEFQDRARHVFESLANGLAFAVGEAIVTKDEQRSEERPSSTGQRTIMGIPVPDAPKPMSERLTGVAPGQSDVDKLRTDVAKAYAAFPTMSNKDIRNTLSEVELRGVAKMAGLPWSKEDVAHITDAYITEIKRAIEDKADADAAQAKADQDADAALATGTQAQTSIEDKADAGGTTTAGTQEQTSTEVKPAADAATTPAQAPAVPAPAATKKPGK